MFYCQEKERFPPLLVEREKQEWFGLLISAEVRLYSKFDLNYQQSVKGSSTSWLVKTEKSVVCSSSQCGYWGILGWYLVWVLASSTLAYMGVRVHWVGLCGVARFSVWCILLFLEDQCGALWCSLLFFYLIGLGNILHRAPISSQSQKTTSQTFENNNLFGDIYFQDCNTLCPFNPTARVHILNWFLKGKFSFQILSRWLAGL